MEFAKSLWLIEHSEVSATSNCSDISISIFCVFSMSSASVFMVSLPQSLTAASEVDEQA
jgi:hypothetical protein